MLFIFEGDEISIFAALPHDRTLALPIPIIHWHNCHMTWKRQPPTYDQLTLPLLQYIADGKIHTLKEVTHALAHELGLDLRTPKFVERISWAKTYLKQAGLLQSLGWGKFRITQRGIDVLKTQPTHINRRFLMQFPEFVAYQQQSRPPQTPPDLIGMDFTPQELMDMAYEGLRQDLADDLLDIVLEASPAFFERLVIDLLLAMGYGGSRRSAGKALGQSGDGGLDGFVQEDKLGLSKIYVQAKRWGRDKPVGRPEIQGFVGSLLGAGGKKGVFMTTSRFTQGAIDYAASITEVSVILIDGVQLTQLMIEHGVGVIPEKQYIIHAIDRDYFEVDG
ncbi:MAG: restriction endonuclease [Phototrophicales bacterium]